MNNFNALRPWLAVTYHDPTQISTIKTSSRGLRWGILLSVKQAQDNESKIFDPHKHPTTVT